MYIPYMHTLSLAAATKENVHFIGAFYFLNNRKLQVR